VNPGAVIVRHGDSREVLRGYPDGHFDSCVCDPPYALVTVTKRLGGPGAKPIVHGRDGAYARQTPGFMGKTWDNGETAFDPAFWAEVWRVLKPGAHLVAFGGTRTYHRLVCAIEDAGFEVRDTIAWLYGSGFPKSHDVAKGIDRVGGLSPKDQAALLRRRREAAGLTRADVAAQLLCTKASVRDWEEGRARTRGGATEWITPSDAYRTLIADLLGYTRDERRLVGVAPDRRGDGTVIGLGHSGVMRAGGTTPEAAAWEGWGTALKPALEPIVLARKPLAGSVAANVLAHGTGALNIDGCRVESPGKPVGEYTVKRRKPGAEMAKTGGDGYRAPDAETFTGEMKPGRWPANVVHDGSAEVVERFPAEAGAAAPVRGNEPSAQTADVYGKFAARLPGAFHGDSGSAARFFYTAKADADDRVKTCSACGEGWRGSKRPCACLDPDDPSRPAPAHGHPTVKPIDLMRWLCRLVTPPGGLVLDPFAGTGTTGEAAVLEGMRAVLIEREAEYVADIERRLAHMRGDDAPLFAAARAGE